jgi:hypothetical protein
VATAGEWFVSHRSPQKLCACLTSGAPGSAHKHVLNQTRETTLFCVLCVRVPFSVQHAVPDKRNPCRSALQPVEPDKRCCCASQRCAVMRVPFSAHRTRQEKPLIRSSHTHHCPSSACRCVCFASGAHLAQHTGPLAACDIWVHSGGVVCLPSLSVEIVCAPDQRRTWLSTQVCRR